MTLEEIVMQFARMNFDIFMQQRYRRIDPAHEEATKALFEEIKAAGCRIHR